MEEFAKKYLEILNGPLKGLNLTRVTEYNEFFQKQIIDSIIPHTECAIFQDLINDVDIVIDVGFGGGFPILPLAKLYPHKKFIGLEARRKKSDAVNLIAKELGLDNVKTYHHRIEEILINRPVMITFKAVSTVANLLPLVNYEEGTDVTSVFYKGPKFFELENLENIPENWESIGFEEVELPGTEGRTFAYFKNLDVPRGTNTNKQLVRLTQFI